MNPYDAPESPPIHKETDSNYSSILTFWENRRLIYNITLFIIGIIGIGVSLSIYSQYFLISAFIIGALIYGICANICYSLGAYLNLLTAIKYSANPEPWKAAYYAGFAFSVFLTLALSVLCIFGNM